MKVLYIGLRYDYMNPNQGFSLEHYNFYDTLRRMDNVDVRYFPYERILEVGRDQMNVEIKKLVQKEKPDILFAVMFTDQLKKEAIKDISENTKTKTVAWFCDDQWRFDNYSKQYASFFNLIATTDPASVEKYHRAGQKNVFQTQWACNHFLYKPIKTSRIYDVTFVGQPHGQRKKFIDKLKKSGVSVYCWGRGWPNGRISQEEMIRIFSQSKINLNFIKVSSSLTAKSFAGAFLKKKEGHLRFHKPQDIPSNLKNILSPRDQIKTRNFEIPGCGGFLLTEYAEGLENFYEIGKEVACFTGPGELVETVQFYLEHDEERERMAVAGYERTIRDHTYEIRFRQIFDFAENI